jgi:hypothetical protein
MRANFFASFVKASTESGEMPVFFAFYSADVQTFQDVHTFAQDT